jgi:hypothetical protein
MYSQLQTPGLLNVLKLFEAWPVAKFKSKLPPKAHAQACEDAYERTITVLPHVGREMSRYVFLNKVYMKGKEIWETERRTRVGAWKVFANGAR